MPHWSLPGGGLGKDEEPLMGAQREVREEIGVELKSLLSLGSFFSTAEYMKDTIHVCKANVDIVKLSIDSDEIKEVRWFKTSDMPKDLTSFSKGALDIWFQSINKVK